MKRKRMADDEAVEGRPVTKQRVTRSGARRQSDEEFMPNKGQSLHVLEKSAVVQSPKVWRNPELQSRKMARSLEGNLLAFCDTHGVRDSGEIEEDKLTFLDVTYAWSVVGADANVPTQKMYLAMFRNIQENQSLELMMASFQLLTDLEKRHPRVAISEEVSGDPIPRLDIDAKVWSPLEQSIEEDIKRANETTVTSSRGKLVSMNLFILVETIANDVAGQEKQNTRRRLSNDLPTCHGDMQHANILGQFLMLQHLVSLIQNDFSCRMRVSEASTDISKVKESYLYRCISACSSLERDRFLSNLVSILNPKPQCEHAEYTKEEKAELKEGDVLLTPTATVHDVMGSNKPGLLPSALDFCPLAAKLLFMVMEIAQLNDTWLSSKRLSHWEGRFVFHNFLVLFNERSSLEAFLQVLDNPRSKLRFIADYFVNHAPKAMVVNGLKGKAEKETLGRLLVCFEEENIDKFLHKFDKDILPLLLAHAFQAYLILHAEIVRQDGEDRKVLHQTELKEVCKSLSAALRDLQNFERQTLMIPIVENALGMADFILAPTNSTVR